MKIVRRKLRYVTPNNAPPSPLSRVKRVLISAAGMHAGQSDRNGRDEMESLL